MKWSITFILIISIVASSICPAASHGRSISADEQSTIKKEISSQHQPDNFNPASGNNDGKKEGIWGKIKKLVTTIIVNIIEQAIDYALKLYCYYHPFACYHV